MTFKLTYATMFEPPEELPALEAATRSASLAQLGAIVAASLAPDHPGPALLEKRDPADHEQLLGRFAAAG